MRRLRQETDEWTQYQPFPYTYQAALAAQSAEDSCHGERLCQNSPGVHLLHPQQQNCKSPLALQFSWLKSVLTFFAVNLNKP